MKKPKKLTALLAALNILLCAVPASAIEEQPYVTAVPYSAASADTESDGFSDGESTSFYSMLPLEEHNYVDAYIDRSGGIPDDMVGKSEYSFRVSEVLSQVLGVTEYSGKIVYSLDNSSYRSVGWNDVVTVEPDSGDSHDYVYFIVGENADDQLDINSIKYRVRVSFDIFEESFFNKLQFEVSDQNGNKIQTYQNNAYQYNANSYNYSCQIMADSIGEDGVPGIKIVLPEGYSSANVSAYKGRFLNEKALANAEDITSSVINGETVNLLEKDRSSFTCDITLAVTQPNGSKYLIPIDISVSTVYTSVAFQQKSFTYYDKEWLTVSFDDNTRGGYYVKKADSFDGIDTNSRLYYRYFDRETDEYYYDLSKITFACFGSYKSLEEAQAAGAVDIKDQYQDYAPVDLSQFEEKTGHLSDGTEVRIKNVVVTIIDVNGVVYNTGWVTAIASKFPEVEEPEKPYVPSKYTDFEIYSSVYVDSEDKPDTKRTVSGYLIDDDYDSYYDDFQTVLLLDDKKPLTAATIYPTFDTSYKANVYAADGKGGNTLQKSGESAVSFVSGKSIQYSVSAEDKEHTKNYWVTFLTQQSGPKLFVNGTNNPSDMSENGRPLRKLFLNAYNGNYHDIAFANIGDRELTGITVSLSEDTVGVKLDPYWNVIGTSKKSLAPFTTTSSSKIDNIAKVRLIPEDENTFSAISGTLTISADNGESVSIDLTGYAGLPQITTDKLYTGVKYVPYSSMIMTNSMLSSDAIEFSISKGKLPAGINLMPNGELYGIPHQVGEFKFTVTAKYVGNTDIGIENYSTSHEYTLIVNDNDDVYVDAVNTDEQGYELTDRVSSYITVYYSDTMGDYPVVDRVVFGDSEGASDAEDVAPAAYYEDNIFRSIGLYSEEFIAFYLDGTKLEEGTDYYAEDGSTVITVLAQAFGNAGLSSADEPHTLAAEFRKDGKKGELRRSAQNVYINFVKSSGSKDPEDKPEEKPWETPEEKPEETPEEKPEDKPINKPSTGTGSSAGSSSGTTNVTVTPLKTVTAFFSVTDENGKAIPDLSVELHSSPKYGTTDGSGSVKFNSVEFGRHTIYINDPASGKKVSKKFSLVAGEEMNVTSDVITAKADETIWVELRFDGKNISLLSAGVNDIAPSAGAFEESEAVSGGFIGLLCSKGMILFILSAAVVICIISKKAKRN